MVMQNEGTNRRRAERRVRADRREQAKWLQVRLTGSGLDRARLEIGTLSTVEQFRLATSMLADCAQVWMGGRVGLARELGLMVEGLRGFGGRL